MTAEGHRATGCLFCGNASARFLSEEHIIPLAAGNNVDSGLVDAELVIAPGVVCDKCNGKRLSQRDNALVSWPPISVFRTLGQVVNRRGGLVDAVQGTQWRVKINASDPRQFTLSADADTGPDSGRNDVARALCKIAVEARHLEDDHDARSPRWDPIAAAAIGGPLPAGIALGLRLPESIEDVQLTPDFQQMVDADSDALRAATWAWVLGLGLILMIGTEPLPLPQTAWWTIDPQTGSLIGPPSVWACFHGEAKVATPLTELPTGPAGRKTSVLPTGDPKSHIRLTSSTSTRPRTR